MMSKEKHCCGLRAKAMILDDWITSRIERRNGMTIKELKEKLEELPEDAGIFIYLGDGVVTAIEDVMHNDITETDYKESYLIY